jgi:kynurenine 3-monooxygenase
LLRPATDWQQAFEQFFQLRKPDTDAIAAMALENFVEMRDTVRDPKFMLRKELSFELERRYPQRFIPRYSMVMFHHDIPYRVALERGRVQAGVLARLTATAETMADIPAAGMDALVTELLEPLPDLAAAYP